MDKVVGKVGLGYFTSSAPLGVRYWLDKNMAIDAGLRVDLISSGSTAYTLGGELGAVLKLAEAGNAVVFARGGVGYQYNRLADVARGQQDLNVNALLGAELFLTVLGFPNVSLQGGYGLQANWTFQGGAGFKLSSANEGLSIVNAGNLGFHIYL